MEGSPSTKLSSKPKTGPSPSPSRSTSTMQPGSDTSHGKSILSYRVLSVRSSSNSPTSSFVNINHEVNNVNTEDNTASNIPQTLLKMPQQSISSVTDANHSSPPSQSSLPVGKCQCQEEEDQSLHTGVYPVVERVEILSERVPSSGHPVLDSGSPLPDVTASHSAAMIAQTGQALPSSRVRSPSIIMGSPSNVCRSEIRRSDINNRPMTGPFGLEVAREAGQYDFGFGDFDMPPASPLFSTADPQQAYNSPMLSTNSLQGCPINVEGFRCGAYVREGFRDCGSHYAQPVYHDWGLASAVTMRCYVDLGGGGCKSPAGLDLGVCGYHHAQGFFTQRQPYVEDVHSDDGSHDGAFRLNNGNRDFDEEDVLFRTAAKPAKSASDKQSHYPRGHSDELFDCVWGAAPPLRAGSESSSVTGSKAQYKKASGVSSVSSESPYTRETRKLREAIEQLEAPDSSAGSSQDHTLTVPTQHVSGNGEVTGTHVSSGKVKSDHLDLDFLRRCLSGRDVSRNDREKALSMLGLAHGSSAHPKSHKVSPSLESSLSSTGFTTTENPAVFSQHMMYDISKATTKTYAMLQFQRMQQDSDRLARIEEKLVTQAKDKATSNQHPQVYEMEKLKQRLSQLESENRGIAINHGVQQSQLLQSKLDGVQTDIDAWKNYFYQRLKGVDGHITSLTHGVNSAVTNSNYTSTRLDQMDGLKADFRKDDTPVTEAENRVYPCALGPDEFCDHSYCGDLLWPSRAPSAVSKSNVGAGKPPRSAFGGTWGASQSVICGRGGWSGRRSDEGAGWGASKIDNTKSAQSNAGDWIRTYAKGGVVGGTRSSTQRDKTGWEGSSSVDDGSGAEKTTSHSGWFDCNCPNCRSRRGGWYDKGWGLPRCTGLASCNCQACRWTRGGWYVPPSAKNEKAACYNDGGWVEPLLDRDCVVNLSFGLDSPTTPTPNPIPRNRKPPAYDPFVDSGSPALHRSNISRASSDGNGWGNAGHSVAASRTTSDGWGGQASRGPQSVSSPGCGRNSGLRWNSPPKRNLPGPLVAQPSVTGTGALSDPPSPPQNVQSGWDEPIPFSTPRPHISTTRHRSRTSMVVKVPVRERSDSIPGSAALSLCDDRSDHGEVEFARSGSNMQTSDSPSAASQPRSKAPGEAPGIQYTYSDICSGAGALKARNKQNRASYTTADFDRIIRLARKGPLKPVETNDNADNASTRASSPDDNSASLYEITPSAFKRAQSKRLKHNTPENASLFGCGSLSGCRISSKCGYHKMTASAAGPGDRALSRASSTSGSKSSHSHKYWLD